MRAMAMVLMVAACGSKEAEPIGPPPVAEFTAFAVKPTGPLTFDLAFVPRDAKHQPMTTDVVFDLRFEQGGKLLCAFSGAAIAGKLTAAGTHISYDLPTTVTCVKPADGVPVTLTIKSDPAKATIEVPGAIRDMLAKLTGPVPIDAAVPPDVLAPPAADAADPAKLVADLDNLAKLVDAVGMPTDKEPARACPDLPDAFDPPAASIQTLQRLSGRKVPATRLTLVDSDSIAVLAAQHDGTALPQITPAVLRQLESGRKLMFVYQWKTFFLPVADQLDEKTHKGSFRPGRADGYVVLMDTAKRAPLCWYPIASDSSQTLEVKAKYNKLDAAQTEAELDFISNLMPELYMTRRSLAFKQQLVPENKDLDRRWSAKKAGALDIK